MTLLAQNFDDWAEIALIAVVVVGSFIANVIKNWTQGREKKALDEQREQARQRRPNAPPVAAPGPFEFPTAKPMPPAPPRARPATGAPPVIERRPITQPRPVIERRTIVIETQRGEAPRPPRVEKAPATRAQPSASGGSRAEPRRPKGRERPTPAPSSELRRPDRPAPQGPPRQPDSTPPAGPRDLEDSISAHEAEMERLGEARIGHVHDGVVAPVVDEEVEVGVEEREIGAAKPPASRISRRALRDGIIMAEILSPPLSVRPPEEAHAL
jgi:hypothetical protein